MADSPTKLVLLYTILKMEVEMVRFGLFQTLINMSVVANGIAKNINSKVFLGISLLLTFGFTSRLCLKEVKGFCTKNI